LHQGSIAVKPYTRKNVFNIEHDSVKEAHVFNTGGENGLSHTEFEVGTTILQLAL
jgi:hypothetical protein